MSDPQATPVYLIPLQYSNINAGSLPQDVKAAAMGVEAALKNRDLGVAGARTNKDLTPEGRDKAVQKAAAAVGRDFEEFIGPILNPLLKAKDRLEGALLAPQIDRQLPAGTDPAIASAVAANHLVVFGPMDETERNAGYLKKARGGDVLALAALEAAKLIDDATIDQGREIYAQRENPEKYELLEQTRAAIRILEGNRREVARKLQEGVRPATEGPGVVPVEDLIAV